MSLFFLKFVPRNIIAFYFVIAAYRAAFCKAAKDKYDCQCVFKI